MLYFSRTSSSVATGLLLLACWLAWPSRNVYGNPSSEHIISQCKADSGLLVRLYEGNGNATVANWYSVTTELGLLKPERQVLFAYSSPIIRSVACESGAIQIRSDSSALSYSETSMLARRGTPQAFWRGKESNGTQPLITATQILAVVIGVAAVMLFARGHRRARPVLRMQ
jgi:hypothetical protein